MLVERTENEILIRISPDIDINDIQDIIDLLKYKELVSKSKATQKDVDELSKEVNRSISERVRKERGLE